MRPTIKQAIQLGWIKEPVPARSALPIRGASRAPRQDREGQAQAELVAWFDLTFPKLAGRLFHIANGGKRTRYERHLLVQQGVRRGVPDLMLPLPAGGYAGLFVEMKAPAPHASPVSEVQQDWITFLRSAGYRVEVCRGADEARVIISRYLPREYCHADEETRLARQEQDRREPQAGSRPARRRQAIGA